MKTEYNNKIIERLKQMPSFHLGQVVNTPDGEGVIVEMQFVSYNGLYIDIETAKATVWYSTDEAQNGFVSRVYRLNELYTIRDHKLNQLI